MPIAIPITTTERRQAHQFAQQQPTQKRSQQVYHNTLAVLVTQRCLQLLGVDTDLEASHSWNPLERLVENVADLYVPSLQGFLECRSLRHSDNKCQIPPEVWTERIGYVIVELDEPYQEGQIVGFVKSVSVTELPRSYFEPLDALLDCFTEPPAEPIVRLGQWLKRRFESDWQPPQDLLNTFRELILQRGQAQLQLKQRDDLIPDHGQFRHLKRSIRVDPNTLGIEDLVNLIQTTQDDEIRWQYAEELWKRDPQHPACPVITAKDLGIYLVGHSLGLMVGILLKSDSRMLIMLRVYPLKQSSHLPPGLKLIVLDEAGDSFHEVESRLQDDYIQFKFTADEGDLFSARVVLHQTNFTEDFVV